MFSKRRSFDHRLCVTAAVALPLCLLLSACGGGGYGVASTPPPPPTPTPTPTPAALVNSQTTWLPSPATRAGSYEVLGTLFVTPANGSPSFSRSVVSGEFTIASDPGSNPPFVYRLTAAAGLLPGGLTSIALGAAADSWDFWPAERDPTPIEGDWTQFFGQRLTASGQTSDGVTHTFSNDFTRGISSGMLGLSPNQRLQTTLDYDIGYSYVAMGEWSWRVVDLNGTAAGDFGDLLFVNGDRTPTSGIPVSGTATYDARTLALLATTGTPGIPFIMTADFGLRIMSARIDQDYRYDPTRNTSDAAILGIHVGGNAAFSNNGIFDIPLNGTANYAYNNMSSTPPTEPVSGMMNGAFFGPSAEQVGGTFTLGRPDGTQLMQDAFVGKQH
jgi:hypothetical protein